MIDSIQKNMFNDKGNSFFSMRNEKGSFAIKTNRRINAEK
jgi:hypothetical protein